MNHYPPEKAAGNAADSANIRAFLQQAEMSIIAADGVQRYAAFTVNDTMTDYRLPIPGIHTEVWQRPERKHLSQLDTLHPLKHNNAVRLENSDDTTCARATIQPDIVLPATVRNGAGGVAGVIGYGTYEGGNR